MADMIGGRYELGSYIGVPGRVDAYEATDSNGERVALLTARADSQVAVDRFAARAQAAAALAHPDIAPITDWGTDGETFYAAEKWITGTDLKTALASRSRAFSGAVVARFGAQVAAALSAAHARAIVHGDLRPEYLIQTSGDDITVAGFGAPTTAEPVSMSQDAPARAAHYLSPEQARGGAPTAASDIYSLGAVLYHLAAGVVPFDGASGPIVAAMHVDREPESPRRVNPEVPASLENVIMKAMHKDPMRRYGSAEEMRADLDRIAVTGAGATTVMPAVTPTPAQPARKGSAWPWIVGILAVILLGVAAWYFFLRGDIEVPDVSGLTMAEAQASIEAAGLTLGEVGYSDSYPSDAVEGTVFEQSPAAGALARDGAPVDITLAGNELADVPDVVGMAESEAVLAIRDAGFELAATEREFSADVAAGDVISQVPSAGTQAPAGSPITIVVSQGTEIVAVPGVEGQTEADATSTLEDAGLTVRVTEDYSDTVPEGSVISQNPTAGVAVDAGTQVTIVVSRGAEPVAQVRVPTLEGLTEADAVGEIEAVGLVAQVETVTDPANVGRVVSQDPARDTMVDPGSTVTITVGE